MAKLFVGYGGRAGTICFCSANVTLAFFIVLGALGLAQFNINSYFRALMLSDLDPVRMLTTVAAGVFGIIATVLLREKLLQKRKAPSEVVLGSATVALVSGLVLPWVVPSLALKVAAVVASGTYAGMVPRKVVAVDVHLVLAGVVVGLLNVLMSTVFIGVGGKLGFMGLLGIELFHYLEDHAHKPAQLQVVAKIG